MTNSTIKNFFNDAGPRYQINSLRKQKILSLAIEDGLSGKNILDIGCASGFLYKDLKRPDNRVIGADISETAIAEAKKSIDAAFCLDIENDPWPEEFTKQPFDLIICAEIIEHLFDQDNFLEKIKKILKPSGKVIISTPNFLTWNNRLRMLFGQFGLKEMLYDKSHIHLLSYNGLREKTRQHGFKIERESHIWYPNWLEKIRRVLPPNLFVFQTIVKLRLNQ